MNFIKRSQATNFDMANCIEIIKPFAQELAQTNIKGQTVGGIGSHVLGLAGVEINPDEKYIAYDGPVELPQYRSDGTKRDLDFLVLDTDEEKVNTAESLARSTLGDALELSFFGLRTMAQMERQARSVASLAKVFVSDRYAEMNPDGSISRCVKALYPFASDMDLASLETWTLKLREDYVLPIPHPGMTIINYATRSIGGLRPKDRAKVNALTENVLDTAPWIHDWIMDGPGKSQIELARILQTIRKPSSRQRPLFVGNEDAYIRIDPYSKEDIVKHEALIVENNNYRKRQAIVAASIAKSRVVHAGENQQRLVSFWLEHVEPRISAIVKNDT